MGGALQLVLQEEVQRVLDHFSSCFDIRIIFFDAAGRQLRVGGNSPSTGYCRLIQSRLYGLDRCHSMDQESQQKAAAEQRTLCYRCHAGLREAIKPILLNGRLVGYVMIGQFRTEDKAPEHVLRDWEEKLGDIEPIKAAYQNLTYVSPEKLEDILSLFSILVEYIISREMVTLRGDVSLEEALTYLKEHVHEPVTLEDVARALHRNPSSVSRMFRKALGTTFKQVQATLKIEHAEEYMRSQPNATVQEAARRVGFDDPFYFSRVYRKVRGEAPSAYLARHRKSPRPS